MADIFQTTYSNTSSSVKLVLIQITLKVVRKCPINNNPALVQINIKATGHYLDQ